ncbi:cytochrome c oxidase accessory protein CcoG [Glaciecola sp. MH2013]|uniref:cytochrome c oxidase accessory protein CcoG n=1 Tax=Glaciecola sp. MH2013 TaxID=2785524 RepID=UPI0018A0AE47|nr:cytochrome c oxidase accessory protein CcoG [Glaciecola sp. MH2013]MBF7071906.1 cytochrome c oxidase accessory protein CcoG [Glaciecola sp. MH2013]
MTEKIKIKDVTPVKIHKPKQASDANTYSARNRIYVRAVEGMLENIRRFFGLIFLGIFAIIPWIQYKGSQAVLFDIGEQRFSIFAMTLWPQDLTILAYIFIVSAFALFFVTTFAGRVWCGFMCPQTTWTFIYIWFEEKIEGSRNKRMKLDQRKMDLDKFTRKFLKHFAWILVALLTSITFVGYFSPIDQLFIDFFTLHVGFWAGFSIIFFTVCTYGNAGYMREIMCTHMCPYARFQSAMFDKDTFTVAYNPERGEQRGPRSRKVSKEQLAEKGLGDCIDCNLCVQVCPTGIDIRNGLQYECINCGACVDACNGVMDKMGYEKGLISFTSEHQLSGGTTKIVRPKLVGYAFVLFIMTSLLVVDIYSRAPLELDIIKDRNSLYRETNQGLIENVYTLKILNKSQASRVFTVSISGIEGANYVGLSQVEVKGGDVYTLPMSVTVDPYALSEEVTEFTFRLETKDENGETVAVQENSKFIFTDV